MKKLILIAITFVAVSTLASDKKVQKISPKVVRILNALNLGGFSSEAKLLSQLSISCQRNSCDEKEVSQVQEMGLRLVHCQLLYLKSKGIENQDSQFLCRPHQAVITCDTLATPLMRKMCYTGNRHNLKQLSLKEAKFRQKRIPASQ